MSRAAQSQILDRAPAETADALPQPPAGYFRLGENGSDADIASPRIEGRIPEGLRGALFRNGPGMFERGGYRKRHLLDGDGFVQRLALADGKASYRARFVRTPKFEAEEAAGRFLRPTWTTRAPGGPLHNVGARIESQAGVTVYEIGGKLVALDEAAPLYELDRDTLATLGARDPGLPDLPFQNKAHTKTDPATGRTVLTGGTFGRTQKLHVVERNADGTVASHRIVADIPNLYIHDFFLTRTKVIFLLHPMILNPFPLLAGLKSVTESLSWRADWGGNVLIVDRQGDPSPKWIECRSVFMWHALNAYERSDGKIVADFVGFDAPDHFIGPDAQLKAYMERRLVRAANAGKVLRWTLDPAHGTVEEAVLSAENHEFPIVDEVAMGARHAMGYFATGSNGPLTSGVARIDVETGRRETFDYGVHMVAGEPIFVRDPSTSDERGWLLQQVLDGERGESFFSVIRSDAVADGPVAKILLDRHAPISFHGCWIGA